MGVHPPHLGAYRVVVFRQRTLLSGLGQRDKALARPKAAGVVGSCDPDRVQELGRALAERGGLRAKALEERLLFRDDFRKLSWISRTLSMAVRP